MKKILSALVAISFLATASIASAAAFQLNQLLPVPVGYGLFFSNGISTSTASATSGPTVAYITATSTLKASRFPLASSTLSSVSDIFWLSGLATPAGAFLAVDENGKVIATTTPTSGGTPASPNTSLQFNNSGSFGGTNLFYSEPSADESDINVKDQTTADTDGIFFEFSGSHGKGTGAGGGILFLAGQDELENGGPADLFLAGGRDTGNPSNTELVGAESGEGNGGYLFLTAGRANGSGDNYGGNLNGTAGAGSNNGGGGSANIGAGAAPGSGPGGATLIRGGNSVGGIGGAIYLIPGDGNSGTQNGYVSIQDPTTNATADLRTDNLSGNNSFYFPAGGGTFVMGSGTTGNCAEWSSTNFLTDTGSPCGSGGSTPGSPFTSLQYNNSGSFGGARIAYTSSGSDVTLKVDDSDTATVNGNTLSITGSNGSTTANGGGIQITSGDGGTTAGVGGAINISVGSPHGAGTISGQNFIQAAGTALGTATGGRWIANAGNGGSTGPGGDVNLSSGAGGASAADGDGFGGDFDIDAGNANGGNNDGGNIVITPGHKHGSGANGFVYIGDPSSGDAAGFDTSGITASRFYVFPDSAGTFCLVGIACDGSGVATTSLAASWPITRTLSASSITFGFNGLATTSTWTAGQVAYVVNGNTVTSVATGTVSSSGGITTTASRSVIGGALAISCDVATASAPGCISASSFNTFTNKIATSAVPTIGNLSMWTGAFPATLGNVATGTVSGSGGITATANQYIIGAGLTIGCTTATASVPGCLAASDFNTFSNKIATSAVPTIGALAMFTGAFPATVGNVATGTVSGSGGVTVTASQYIIGSGLTIGCTTATASVPGCIAAADFNAHQNKVATSAVPTIGNLAMWTGAFPATVGNVATGTLAATSPVTVTAGQSVIGSGATIACPTCNTSNATVSSIATTWPITGGTITTTGTLAFNGLSTTSPWTIGQIAYVADGNHVTSAATGTVSGAGGVTVTAAQSIIGSGLTITCTAATASVAGCLNPPDFTTFNMKVGTTSSETAGQVAVWGTTSGSPPKLYSVATTSETCTSPLSCTAHNVLGGGGAITIADAAADGSTKGAATFTATDFNSSSGNISLDFTNAQKASASQPGFLAGADFNTFSNKVATSAVPTIGNLSMWTGAFPATLGNVSTSSASCTSGVSCSAFTVVGTVAPSITLTNSSLTVTAGSGLSGGGSISLGSSATIYAATLVGTSSAETAGQVPYWTTSSAFPAKLTSIATSTQTFSSSAFSTTGTVGNFIGGTSGTLSNIVYPSFTVSTTTAWAGTTTIPLGPAFTAETWNAVMCVTDAGTLNVDFYYGSGPTHMALLNASTTVGTFNWATNNTPAAANVRKVDIGTPASSPKTIACTVKKTI